MNRLVKRLLSTHYQFADTDTVFFVNLLHYIQVSLLVFVALSITVM